MSSSSDLLKRTLPIAILSLALIAVPILILDKDGLPRLRSLEKELQTVRADNDELRRDVDHLRGEVRRLRDDPVAIERIAREGLGMVKKNEVVFQFSK